MFVDLVLTDDVFDNLGYSKIIKVDILEPKKMPRTKTKDLVIVNGSKQNRKVLENRNVDILLSPEKAATKDTFHFRDSGLNHVLCKIAKKNNIAIGISFNDILKSMERSILLGRIMQNIRLCRKYKIRIVFASFATNRYEMRLAKDMISFAMVLGMTPGEAKSSLMEAYNILKKKETYVSEGVQIVR